MKNNTIIFIFIFIFLSPLEASIKNKIIINLENTKNFSFNFKQVIDKKTEKGNCIIQYPKKIYCNYHLSNKKILVSNGKSLAIKTRVSYYLYPIEKTPLNLILDKNYLINKIRNLEGRIIEDKFINYTFVEKGNEINIFFNKINFDLIGWQTLDIYQNLSITYLSSILKNQDLDKNIFVLPKQY